MKRWSVWIAGILVLAAMCGYPMRAIADQVVLRTKDGAFEIRGEVIEFDGKLLKVRSNLGEVTIPLDQVSCSGPGCPTGTGEKATDDGQSNLPDLRISVAPDLPASLISRLVTAYSQADGIEVAADSDIGPWTINGPAGGFRLTISSDGQETAGIRIGGPGNETAPYSQTIALEPIVLVTGPGNRPPALTLQQIASIFSGELANWQSLNVRPGRVIPALPARDTAVDSVLTNDVLGPGSSIVGSINRVENVPAFLLSNAGSVALIRGSSKSALRSTPIGGDCGLTAQADEFGIKSGQYPLVRPIVLVADSNELAAPIRSFFTFMKDPLAQDAIAATGLTSLSIIRSGRDRQADWIASAAKLSEFIGGGAAADAALQELVQLTSGASRLSITPRYVFARGGLTPDARGDFDRLAAAIEMGLFDGNAVLFLGFSDAGAAVIGGRRPSAVAAETALSDFLQAHPSLATRPGIQFSAVGFGGIAPLLCSGSAAERAVNQRVEIWVKPL